MRNIILILNAILLVMTISIVIMPNIWTISVVGGKEGIKGVAFPLIWTIYVVSVFITSAFSFSWLIRK